MLKIQVKKAILCSNNISSKNEIALYILTVNRKLMGMEIIRSCTVALMNTQFYFAVLLGYYAVKLLFDRNNKVSQKKCITMGTFLKLSVFFTLRKNEFTKKLKGFNDFL